MIYCIDLFLPFHLQMYVLHVDEEIGGSTGMKQFVKTDDFKAMNLGFALDEGMQGSIFALSHDCIGQQ